MELKDKMTKRIKAQLKRNSPTHSNNKSTNMIQFQSLT
jgi:hypothetical protein